MEISLSNGNPHAGTGTREDRSANLPENLLAITFVATVLRGEVLLT